MFNHISKILLLAIFSVGIFTACSDDDNGGTDAPEEYILSQEDLNNVSTVIRDEITGTEFGEDVSIPHGGQDLTADETIRHVLANQSDLSNINVGTIIVKHTYLKDENDEKGQLLATFAMVKRGGGFDPDNQDWWWLKMPNTGDIDYDTYPNGNMDKAAASGKIGGCNGCHGKDATGDYVFLNDK